MSHETMPPDPALSAMLEGWIRSVILPPWRTYRTMFSAGRQGRLTSDRYRGSNWEQVPGGHRRPSPSPTRRSCGMRHRDDRVLNSSRRPARMRCARDEKGAADGLPRIRASPSSSEPPSWSVSQKLAGASNRDWMNTTPPCRDRDRRCALTRDPLNPGLVIGGLRSRSAEGCSGTGQPPSGQPVGRGRPGPGAPSKGGVDTGQGQGHQE
jgi:hypothetical protein